MDFIDTTDMEPRLLILEALIANRNKLEQTLRDMKANLRENREIYFGDSTKEDVDRAEKERAVQACYNTIDRKNQELKRLEILINQITQNEEFGICEECGEEIGYKRLLAIPYVTRCIDCQREFENESLRGKIRTNNFFSENKIDDFETDYIAENFKSVNNGADNILDDFDDIDFEGILAVSDNPKPQITTAN